MVAKQEDFNPQKLPAEFVKLYNGTEGSVSVFASPARINIIGEHIDYNGGKVFPTAIDKYLYVAIRKREDTAVIYQDLKFPGLYKFDINDNFTYKKENDYANYLNGILSILKSRGCTFPCGFEVLMVSNVPPAGGISSSSALECGFAYAVSELFNFAISRKDIALIGQQSEHDFMNVNCGIMDQYIIATGKKDTAELLDCAKIEHEYVPLVLGDYRFVVMNTKKKRQLADSKYNERRSQCEQGLAELQKAATDLPDGGLRKNTRDLEALCELTVPQFAACETVLTDPVIQKRVRHCVTENGRVLEAVSALKAGNLNRLGELLRASHESLKTDYEVTGIELDTLAAAANVQDGCIGARMTGAGFGGCAIALVHKDKISTFIDAVQKKYTKAIGHDAGFFACTSGDGVHRIK
ncbi:MAG: galactokinase [Treponema sp.]|jgi:galactokinase|nr:galactokinase [Treponema sp.]